MSSLEGQSLTYAVLVGPIFVQGVGSFGPTLQSTHSGIHNGTKMTVDGNWVKCEVEKEGRKGVTFVPYTMFTHVVPAK